MLFRSKGIEKGKGVKTTYNYASKKSTTPVGATMNLGGVKVELGKKGMKKEEVEHVEEGAFDNKLPKGVKPKPATGPSLRDKLRDPKFRAGHKKTQDKMYGPIKKVTKEEVEQVEEATLSAKAARAGKDIGKKGKNFKKIAAKAGKKYGSKAAGERVAGAILAKMRAKAGK